MDLSSIANRTSAAAARARGGGGFYHLSFRSGSRAGGASARGGVRLRHARGRVRRPAIAIAAIYTESDHMPSWAEDDPARVLGCGRPLRARERPALRQRRFRAAARSLRRGSDRAGARIRARAHRRRAAPVHARDSRRPRRGRSRAQPPRAPDVLRASERRHRAIARRVVPARQFRASRTRRRAEEPHVSRTGLGRAGPRALGGPHERDARTVRAGRAGRSSELRAAGRRSGARRALRPRPLHTWSAGARITTAWTTRPSDVDEEQAIREHRRARSRDWRPRKRRSSATGFPMTSGNASRATTRTRILRAGRTTSRGRGSHVERP